MGKQQDHVEVLRYLRDNAYITADEWATIRAHIEGLEARLSTALEDRREWYAKAAERLKWVEAAEARVRELEADAARYRWLRDNAVRCLDNPDVNYVGSELRFRFDHLRDETLDAAIDTAMQAGRDKGNLT